MNRRQFLLTSAAVLAAPTAAASAAALPAGLDAPSPWRPAPAHAPWRVVTVDPDDPGRAALRLHRRWLGARCTAELVNTGQRPVRIQEIVLLELEHALPATTQIQGEGFQMLTEFSGTLAQPRTIGYSDAGHYRIPQPSDVSVAATGLLLLTPPGAPTQLLAFASCHRFCGRFYLWPGRLQAVLDAEGLALLPGESWRLEELLVLSGPSRPRLLASLAAAIARQHPPLRRRPAPTGWSSWYSVGHRVTAETVMAAAAEIRSAHLDLRTIQIDDGFEPVVGDWLDPGPGFGADMAGNLRRIEDQGLDVGVWLAPYVTRREAPIFTQHPEWLMQAAAGGPLPSESVTFGGWGGGHWYALDGSHPGVQAYFTDLFATIRRRWNCRYFKLDALFWGAMQGGRLHDPRATRIQAYRRGLRAMLRGAGADSYILGCNHPIWASLGLIHGSRSSNDISRRWPRIRQAAEQTLLRNWQNGRLWWNDPDAVLLTGPLSDDEFQFHVTAALASGGAILSGDVIRRIPPARLAWLRRLLPPSGVAAAFEDTQGTVGRIRLPGRQIVCCFNPGDAPRAINFALPAPCRMRDFWSGQDLGRQAGVFALPPLPPHSARALECLL